MKKKLLYSVIFALAVLGVVYYAARATVNTADAGGLTSLHFAALEGNGGKMAWLIFVGGHVDTRAPDGQTPLHFAQDPDVVSVLHRHHADLNVRTNSGDTPLHFAALEARPEVVHRLIALGADVNARNDEGDTPLHAAVHGENRLAVKLLLANGADLTARNAHGVTPLQMAKQRKAQDIEKMLGTYAAKLKQ